MLLIEESLQLLPRHFQCIVNIVLMTNVHLMFPVELI